MDRIEHLNAHLINLINLQQSGDYSTEIQNTVLEIEKELNINGNKGLSSYSTRELQEELSKRSGVHDYVINSDQELVIETFTGDVGRSLPYSGPVRVLVKQD